VRAGGGLVCWGAVPGCGEGGDGSGPVCPGDTDRDPRSLAERAARPEGRFVAVASGSAHVCALRAGGEIACWGQRPFVELPDGVSSDFVPLW
jgi:hypothetical protein